MDKNILNAVAEVLKDERAKFDRQISELRERTDKAIGNDADISELKASIEFLFEEVDKKTDSIDFELAVMTKKESEEFLFQKIKEQTAALQNENASALDKIESAIKSLKDGADGADGSDGSDGKDGADGRDGIDNPAIAPIEIASDHKAEKGLIVKHRGGLWQAIRNTNGDPDIDSGNWKCFVDGVSKVDITFNAKEGVYTFDVEKSNGERESLSIDRMPAYLPPSSDHKSVEGDYFLDGTSLNLYLDSEWVAVDLKGNRGDAGENGNRGRKGRDGVGISEIFVADGNLKILLTDGEVKDIYLDVLNSQPEDIDQEIKRYAGIWHTSQSYQAGDVCTMMGALYVCTSPSNESPESSDNWELMVAPAIGGAGGDGESSSGVFPTYAIVGESAPSSVGKKFSSFSNYTGTDQITAVGLDKDGHNIKFGLTTDAIQVNPNPFRNAKNGQFIGTPEELAALKNQRDVNEFLYGAISDIEAGDIDLEGYATEDWVLEQLEGPTQDEKLAAIEAQIQFRGLMELDADGKPVWPADQVKEKGGWWAYPSSKFSNTWKYENLEWVFTKGFDINGAEKAASPKYAVGDIIQMQISNNEAGAGTGYQYADTSAVFVEYKVEELYYPDRLSGSTNTDFPAYRVSKFLPDYRYAGSLPNVVKGLQDDADDSWIQWYPTKFAFGATASDGGELDERYVNVSGDTMTGALETPDLIVKDTTPGTEASVLIEGWVDGADSAARILMSNKQYNNAYGSISFKGNNADGWFQFNKDLDMSGKGVHSVNRIRFSGEKSIQDGNTNRILLNGKVTIPKAGDSNVDGFTVKGKTDAGLNANLLYVYHNSSGLDALNYAGRQTAGSENIATCKYVDDKVGAIPAPTAVGSLVTTSFGCKYYRSSNSNDFTFYTQDSNNALNSAHSSTKFITIRLPSDFWMVKAGVVPAGTDMGYITITSIGDGKVLYSGQAISVSYGFPTFKVDSKKDLWASGSYGEGTNYLIRMESCFREK